MEFVVEAFPFAFGVLLGLSCARWGGLRRRPALWLLASVALGAFATLASGEWQRSALYFLVDVAIVAGVSAASAFAVERRWLRPRAGPRRR